MELRTAFCGASGTGKTTLIQWLSETFQLEINPVGSRSVAKAMGFDNPYDVDAAGKRAEFQERLLTDKMAWEREHESFVVDRTTFDNLVYTALHKIEYVNNSILARAIEGMRRYTHVIYCPSSAFLDTAGDPHRVANTAYHKVYDACLYGLLTKYYERPFTTLGVSDLGVRKMTIESCLK